MTMTAKEVGFIGLDIVKSKILILQLMRCYDSFLFLEFLVKNSAELAALNEALRDLLDGVQVKST